jgi:hypothetical protein
MAFISNKITSTEFVGPLTGTATTASLALSSSAAISASHANNADNTTLFANKDIAQFITTGSVDNNQTITG